MPAQTLAHAGIAPRERLAFRAVGQNSCHTAQNSPRRLAAPAIVRPGNVMQHSTERILTTHAGSLPRPPDLLQMIRARENGESVDEQAFAARVRSAVADIVRQ